MSRHRIVEVEPFDPGQVDPGHDAYLLAELAAPAGVTSPWQLGEVRAMMQDQGTRHRLLGLAGTVDDRWGTLGRRLGSRSRSPTCGCSRRSGPTSAW